MVWRICYGFVLFCFVYAFNKRRDDSKLLLASLWKSSVLKEVLVHFDTVRQKNVIFCQHRTKTTWYSKEQVKYLAQSTKGFSVYYKCTAEQEHKF